MYAAAATSSSADISSLNESSSSTNHDITVGWLGTTSMTLSVLLNEAANKIKLPYTTMEGIWKKATSLTTETNAVVPAPGFGDKDRMVKSKSGSAPHLVKVANCQYICDNQCPQFKSINICSHVVAAAESNGDLASFVDWFCTRRDHSVPNLMQMAVHGMPPGAGSKGGKAARKKGKPKQAPSDENRVPLNIASCSQTITNSHHTDATTETRYSSSQSISSSSTDPAETRHSSSQSISLSSTDPAFQQSYQSQSMDHTLYPWMCSPIHHLQNRHLHHFHFINHHLYCMAPIHLISRLIQVINYQ